MDFNMPGNGISPSASARDRSRTPVPPSRGQQLLGTVKSFNGTWGFLQSPEIAGDILCHTRDSPQLTGLPLLPGEAVKFHIMQGPGSPQNNGMKALNVQRQEPADMQDAEWATGALTNNTQQPSQHSQVSERVLGTLKKKLGSNGFCSVEGFADDVLLGDRCLAEAGLNLQTLQIGANLTFEMTMSPKGYRAINIQQAANAGLPGNEGERVVGTLKKIHLNDGFCSVEGYNNDILLGYKELMEAGIILQTMQLGDSLTFDIVAGFKGYHAVNIQKSHVGKRVVGMLKKTHGSNGFCSVEGVANDVLLGDRCLAEAGLNLQTLQIGENLTFEMTMTPKGYRAINIQRAANGPWSPGGKGAWSQGGKGAWSQGGKGGGNRVVGTLKKTHGDNGFCSVEGVTNDVLLGGKNLAEAGLNLQMMQIGDSLTFEMAMGPKGYYAINIQESHVGKRVIGTLKKTHGDNGFCSVEGVANDVLLGDRSLAEAGLSLQMMQLGDNLTFEMTMGPKGYRAINIQLAAADTQTQPKHVGQRSVGRLKSVKGSVAFCFVEGVSGDVLLAESSLNDSGVPLERLQVGDVLSFDMARGPKGYYATNIQKELEIH